MVRNKLIGVLVMLGDNTWLKNLKKGDKVIAVGFHTEVLCTVEKVSPTGRITTTGGSVYNPDGWMRGGGPFPSCHLVEATEEAVLNLLQKKRIEKARQLMKKYSSSDLSCEVADAIINILDKMEDA